MSIRVGDSRGVMIKQFSPNSQTKTAQETKFLRIPLYNMSISLRRAEDNTEYEYTGTLREEVYTRTYLDRYLPILDKVDV